MRSLIKFLEDRFHLIILAVALFGVAPVVPAMLEAAAIWAEICSSRGGCGFSLTPPKDFRLAMVMMTVMGGATLAPALILIILLCVMRALGRFLAFRRQTSR